MARKEVEWFADQMEKKLSQNDHKGGWQNCDFKYLLKRLKEEQTEVEDALKLRGTTFFGTVLKDKEIIDECADVANFAMMIADKLRTKRRKK